MNRHFQHSAKLLIHLHTKLCRAVPTWLQNEAGDRYAKDQRTVPLLCETLKGLGKHKMEQFVYDGKDPMARKLADWWEAHQEEDRERLEEEAREKNDAALKQKALAKLTPDERRALGHE